MINLTALSGSHLSVPADSMGGIDTRMLEYPRKQKSFSAKSGDLRGHENPFNFPQNRRTTFMKPVAIKGYFPFQRLFKNRTLQKKMIFDS